ncbi:MAG: serine/threonine-protein phosphatase [Desulfobacterales bacterium]|nr:serine/threonine-protein phosphatase [Desulfobacterales bacterium]
MFIVESAGITDVGRKRKNNEDSLFLDGDQNLYVVADGMGGHQAGEVASRLVIETIRDYMKRYKKGESVEEFGEIDETLSVDANRLLASIKLANKTVYQLSKSRDAYRGMGSTVSAVLFGQDTVIISNVGDSPMYLVHKDEIELISEPHTVMAEQAAIDPDGANNLSERYKHMLTRGMGIEETVVPHICEIQCFKGDIIVFSSDGLTDKVSAEEILKVVRNESSRKACRILVDLANSRGGDDNITIIIVRVKDVKKKKSFFYKLLSKIFKIDN